MIKFIKISLFAIILSTKPALKIQVSSKPNNRLNLSNRTINSNNFYTIRRMTVKLVDLKSQRGQNIAKFVTNV